MYYHMLSGSRLQSTCSPTLFPSHFIVMDVSKAQEQLEADRLALEAERKAFEAERYGCLCDHMR